MGTTQRIRDEFEIPAISIASVEPDGDVDQKTLAAMTRLVEKLFPSG